mmetsp:Transcript_32332/g.91644  ORF Transcript_32332/g.91644 Transcript_32332/m.91644 type:complete len:218 (+) Transcript_32332:545-1198(+)
MSAAGGAAAPVVPATTCGQLREYCGPFCMNKWTQKILLLSVFAIFLIFMQILNSAGVDVYVLGILPRTAEGLAGLIGAPWVHINWKHLIGNLLGWYLLGFLVLLHGRRVFILLYLFCSIVGGFAVWVVAREVRHIGLSGVIFGFFGFLVRMLRCQSQQWVIVDSFHPLFYVIQLCPYITCNGSVPASSVASLVLISFLLPICHEFPASCLTLSCLCI